MSTFNLDFYEDVDSLSLSDIDDIDDIDDVYYVD